jgi:TetR/AcrR family transcriptional repressor of nem operon
MGRPAKLEQDEVLKRATRLFWAKGSDALSTRDLEEALELRAPAIYRRFPSKNHLLARCIDHYVDTVIATRVRRYLEGADDPLQGLHDFFTSTLQPYDCKPRVRGCLLANTAAHANGQVPEVRAAIFRGWGLIDCAFQQQISRAQRAGQIDTDLDPAALSQSLVMSLEGLLTIVRVSDTDMRPGVDMIFRLLRGRAKTS